MSSSTLKTATEQLLGIVTGLIADNDLNEMEVRFLHEWLALNEDVAHAWPGRAIAEQVRAVLADGQITSDESAHLLDVLKRVAVSDFAGTASAQAEVIALPLDDTVAIELEGQTVCFTGTFLYGTRAACEKRAAAAGAKAVGHIRSDVRYLIVGTNVSPAWQHTSYGNKISAAVELRARGVQIHVVSERRWVATFAPVK